MEVQQAEAARAAAAAAPRTGASGYESEEGLPTMPKGGSCSDGHRSGGSSAQESDDDDDDGKSTPQGDIRVHLLGAGTIEVIDVAL